MKYSYYPGCTLKTKAKDLEKYALESAKLLNVTLEEIENWQCCGGVYPQGSGDTAPKIPSVRALIESKKSGNDLLTLCSACHNVLKRVNNDVKNRKDFKDKVNLYLDENYDGETKVIHYLEMLQKNVTFNKVKETVKNSLNGKKVGAYYGCLLLRPEKVMDFDNAENPNIMEEFIEALGGTPVKFPYRTECCGGYLTVNNKDISESLSEKIIKSAEKNGIEELITACPLCKYNLEKRSKNIKVTYFSEMLGEALGVKEFEEEIND